MNAVSTDTVSIYETVNMSLGTLTEIASFDLMPGIFHGIHVNTFGSSRKNPFMKLKAVAMNEKIAIEDRMQACRYMNKIPHKEMMSSTTEAVLKILDDDSCPVNERYFFFSNNEKHTKLDDSIARAGYYHFFKISANKKYPLILRLLTAQYIYTTATLTRPEWTESRDFIIKLATDKEETVRLRSEAADILCKKITLEDGMIGRQIIEDLGSLYTRNRISTLYTNAQNAHDDAVTESAMNVLRNLMQQPAKFDDSEKKDPHGFSSVALPVGIVDRNTGEIYDKLIDLTKNNEERKTMAISSFNFILIYPAKFEGILMRDVMSLVWNKIHTLSPDIIKELENRFLEELIDMDQTCGSGILTRLINVLSGFVSDTFQIKMSIKDQIRSNILARLGANLRQTSEKMQETVLAEISSDGDKSTAKEFVESFSVEGELKEEFIVDSKLISDDAFNAIYVKTIDDFLGIYQKTSKITSK